MVTAHYYACGYFHQNTSKVVDCGKDPPACPGTIYDTTPRHTYSYVCSKKPVLHAKDLYRSSVESEKEGDENTGCLTFLLTDWAKRLGAKEDYALYLKNRNMHVPWLACRFCEMRAA